MDERKAWQQSVQKVVAIAFKNLAATYNALVIKVKETLEKNKTLVGMADHWKKRAEKAEQDLAVKPLEEIKADRERRALIRLRQQGAER
jgi:hypothetical protein